jgi:hypothetical protein
MIAPNVLTKESSWCAKGKNSMRFRRLLVAEALALIFTTAIAGCGQLTTPAQQSAPAIVQQTPLPAVHIRMIVDRSSPRLL